jgi:hypothetical protein
MNMTFDPVPEDIWEDWKWFVYPEGYILGMKESAHRVGGSQLAMTPYYVVNLPKLIMSEVMWASRLKSTPDGVVDTNDCMRPVNVSIDSLIEGLIYVLSQYPMVISKRVGGRKDIPEKLGQMLEGSEELILLGGLSNAEQSMSLEDVEVEFRNPYGESGRPGETFIALIPAESCIRELSLAKADLPRSPVRETIQGALNELQRRGMIDVKEGTVVVMTERGRTMIEFEPVKDSLSCRCEVEHLNDV